jgi:2-methylcitrate dehydratase PrpD
MNKTDLFLLSINDISKKHIPEPVKLRLKLALLDYIGVTFAGVKAQGEKFSKMISETDDGKSSVIGIDKELSMENAVFYNGLAAHALDFDDGTNAGIIHLGSPIFSVLLPIAKIYHIPVDRFVKAAVIGYETSFTMAMSIQPRHKELGYHATGTCGTLGIALAVSELLDFTERQRRGAFSVAAVSATGTLKVLEEGSELKPYNVAKAALMGYTAAKMGKAEYEVPDDVLSGDRGFLKIMNGDDTVELKLPLLNATYAIEKAYIKPYAACRYCHPAIEAALTIRNKYDITSLKQVHSIKIKTYYLAVNKHDHTEIAGCGSAKMSIPYSVAVALYRGKAGMPEYEIDCVANEEILDLTRKISVESDDKISANFPEKQTAIVEVTTSNGKVYYEQVDYPKGEPENPMSVDEVKEKFVSLTMFSGRTAKEANEIFNAVMDIETRFDDMLNLIRGTRNH